MNRFGRITTYYAANVGAGRVEGGLFGGVSALIIGRIMRSGDQVGTTPRHKTRGSFVGGRATRLRYGEQFLENGFCQTKEDATMEKIRNYVSISLVMVCARCQRVQRRTLLVVDASELVANVDDAIKYMEEDGWVISFESPGGKISGAICPYCKGKESMG